MHNPVKYILLIYLLVLLQTARAQTEIQFSSYLFNGLSINPAYAGSQECLNLNIWGKKQWAGFYGAPTSAMFSIHSPVKDDKISLGLNLFNDSWGVNSQTGISGVYAYRIRLTEKLKLSAGLQGGIINHRQDLTALTRRQEGDPVFDEKISTFSGDFAAGLFLSSDRFFAGASATHLQRNFFKPSTGLYNIRKQYFAYTGYVLDLGQELKLKSSVLFRLVEGSKIQADFNGHFLIREVLWLGASYRTNRSYLFLTQMVLSTPFQIGYAMDVNTGLSTLRNYISHEVMVNYKFSFKRSGITTPRYF
jgi:type IX secretion system PorP/SprF family membrane protein